MLLAVNPFMYKTVLPALSIQTKLFGNENKAADLHNNLNVLKMKNKILPTCLKGN